MKIAIKYLFMVFALLGAYGTSVLAQDFGLPKELTVLSETLVLKEQTGDETQGIIAEYIHSGKTWDDWTMMFAVRFVPGSHLDPIASGQAIVENVNAQKNSDPFAQSVMFVNDANTEAIVDFMVSNKNPGDPMFEHNIWKFFKVEKGIISFQIARRVYSVQHSNQEIKDFFQSVSDMRNEIIQEINRADLPVPVLVK